MDDESGPKFGLDHFAIPRQKINNGPIIVTAHPRLESFDVWSIQTKGDWLFFEGNLPATVSPRGYRMHKDRDAILAQSTSNLIGIFELGGQISASASKGTPAFPYHVFSANDDIGPVGMAGVMPASSNDELGSLREQTAPALIAETLLQWCQHTKRALPLFYVRTETDSAISIDDFGKGQAVQNLERAVENWTMAAELNDLQPKLGAVILDIAGDDDTSDASKFYDDMLSLCAEVTEKVFKKALDFSPKFISLFDSGTQRPLGLNAIEAQWKLSLFHDEFDYIVAAPAYMIERDMQGWYSDRGRLHKSEIMAAALTYVPDHNPKDHYAPKAQGWHCPTGMHAEWQGDGILVTCRALDALVVDETDPFSAGTGFRILESLDPTVLLDVEVTQNDPKTLFLRCSNKPTDGATLAYACGAAMKRDSSFPVNAGCIRDGWAMQSRDGTLLHRWMLPFHLTITGL